MSKKMVTAVIVAFVMFSALGYLVHGYLLADAYGRFPNLWRTTADSTKHMPFILLANLVTAVAFVWIYERGRQEKSFLGQGLRYGIAMAALVPAAKFITYYAIQPIPHSIALHQILFDGIATVLTAVVVAWIEK
ncbi:MAG TPA: hypothetical protein VN613_09310 [Gemmatimonadaceae bacterium]|nr:hypothetical protein [Gemmatimonadaceae bacterium]